MANKKIKFPLWLMPDTKATVECLYRQDGCNSQSEFIEKAILFYCGYLQSEYAGDFLPKILGETLEAILSMFGDRIGKLLLKQAVEQNVCNHTRTLTLLKELTPETYAYFEALSSRNFSVE